MVLAASLALLALLVALAPGAGEWLSVADPVQASDAVFVISGMIPSRALGGADLHRRALADRVVLSLPSGNARSQERETLILQRAGVPTEAIVRLVQPVSNTEEELSAVFAYAQSHGFRRVILVTSSIHTRRVRLIWRHRHQRIVSAVVHPTPYEPFSPRWSSRSDLPLVLHELGGITYFFFASLADR